ncbi:MAG: N-acetyltransferase [marine bacterium B5-7]|nr:MAG: N-acetyltransferase [marine bacterium B5-7]
MLSRVLPLITQANPKLLASGLYYVAQDAEDALVGCGGWSPEQPGEDGSQQGVGHIRHFATHPDFLGVGIGRAIYQQCETQAIVAGIVRFVCYSSLNAEPFYTALGFNTVGPTTVRMSSGCVFPIMQMQRTIKSTWRFSGG